MCLALPRKCWLTERLGLKLLVEFKSGGGSDVEWEVVPFFRSNVRNAFPPDLVLCICVRVGVLWSRGVLVVGGRSYDCSDRWAPSCVLC